MRGLNRLFPERDSFHQSRETILFRMSPTSIEEEEAHLTSLIKELEIDVGLENAQSSQYFYILYSISKLLDLLSPLLNSKTNTLLPPPPPPPPPSSSSSSSSSPSPSPSPSFLNFLSTEQRRKAVLERRKTLFEEAERVSSLVVEKYTKSSEVFNVISLELSRILRKEGKLLESLRLIRFTFRNAILFALGNNTLESLRTVNGFRRGVDVTHYYQVASAESELAKALLKPSQYPFFNIQDNIENEEDKNYSYHSLFGEVEPEDFHPVLR
jgi:hypothetical protein